MRHLSDSDARGLKPASEHYTAYVGPPEQYDLMGAMQFGILTSLGLRDNHRVLDFGCGSLRAGRLLIPYLNAGGYHGIEPNAWLIEDAIDRQLGRDIIRLKQPRFAHGDDFNADQFDGTTFNYILAQSIFSHSGPALTAKALGSFASVLAPRGLCAVTFIIGDEDTPEGWFYADKNERGNIKYRPQLIRSLVKAAGLRGAPIPWYHPRQQWWVLGRELPDDEHLGLLNGVVLRVKEFARGTARALAKRNGGEPSAR